MMKLVVWCQGRSGTNPRDQHEHPEWRAREIGIYDVEVVPRVGDHVEFKPDEAIYEVKLVSHWLYNPELHYIEVEWVPERTE